MGLRDFFRRHANVFSYTTDEVDGGSGNEDMLVEEYGERAVEAEQAPTSLLNAQRIRPLLRGDVSYDEIADGDVAQDEKP
jgi:hypothetical protein